MKFTRITVDPRHLRPELPLRSASSILVDKALSPVVARAEEGRIMTPLMCVTMVSRWPTI